jgi:hypothetical protein
MSTTLAGKHDVMRWAAAVGLTAGLACTASPYPSPDYRIQLPPGVSSDATQFRNSIQQYQVTNQHDRARPATCSKCIVMVHIDVLGDTRSVDPLKAPVTGFPVAHLVNVDDRDTEAYFELAPRTSAEYYVWVDDNGSKKPRATLLEVAGNTVTASKQWNLILCHPFSDQNPRTGPDFDFYEYKHQSQDCEKLSGDNKSQVSYASVFTGDPLQPFFAKAAAMLRGRMTALRGDWIECTSGCCT